jgi:hypothetical protein
MTAGAAGYGLQALVHRTGSEGWMRIKILTCFTTCVWSGGAVSSDLRSCKAFAGLPPDYSVVRHTSIDEGDGGEHPL